MYVPVGGVPEILVGIDSFQYLVVVTLGAKLR